MKIQFILFFISLFFFNCKQKNDSNTKLNSKKPNILLICIDDLRPDLNSFGAKHIISPNIDSLAKKGTIFKRHYVNSPSCGPSRYTLLTGVYGSPHNNALFTRAKKIKDSLSISPSMPEWFKNNGYRTVSVGKVSHHPGGRGGIDWNDSLLIEMPNAWDKHIVPTGDWQHPRGIMHGLANGEIRKDAKQMDVYQSSKNGNYPDDLIVDEAIQQMKDLSLNKAPFFLAVGILKPHLPFGSPSSYYDLYKNTEFPEIINSENPSFKSTWHNSSEFMQYNTWGKNPNTDLKFAEEVRKHYAACVSYADAQVGKLMYQLKKLDLYKNTIIVLWGDHGWHLGEHSIWGKHSLFEESLRSPLLIYNPKSAHSNRVVNQIVETTDIFPTLCDLAEIEIPKFTEGISLKEVIDKKKSIKKTAFSYTANAKSIRTKDYRLILHDDGFVELYNHLTDSLETKNLAKQEPNIVAKLVSKLKIKGL